MRVLCRERKPNWQLVNKPFSLKEWPQQVLQILADSCLIQTLTHSKRQAILKLASNRGGQGGGDTSQQRLFKIIRQGRRDDIGSNFYELAGNFVKTSSLFPPSII